MVGNPCQSRYVKFLWRETCLLFTLRLVSYMPTAGATSGKPVSAVAFFLLWMFYGTLHPTSILLREKGSFIHSQRPVKWQPFAFAAGTRRAHAPGQWASDITVQNNHGGVEHLGKRRLYAALQAHWGGGVCVCVCMACGGSAFLTCSPGDADAGDLRTLLHEIFIAGILGPHKPPTIMHWAISIISM